MALRLSTGLRNFMLQHGSAKNALQNGEIQVYSGAQPATADAAKTGTLLVTLTEDSDARTAEVLATGTMTLTGGASGSIDTVTVDGVNIIPQGAVAFNSSLTQTAADLAAAINLGMSSPEYTATSDGAVVTITAKRGTGAGPNTFVVTATLTTITASYTDMASGVSAVNGLRLGNAAAGVLSKDSTQTWSGVAVADGTAGWARYVGSVADAGGADATGTAIRLDGSCGTSGTQFNLSTTVIASGATITGDSFSATMPSA